MLVCAQGRFISPAVACFCTGRMLGDTLMQAYYIGLGTLMGAVLGSITSSAFGFSTAALYIALVCACVCARAHALVGLQGRCGCRLVCVCARVRALGTRVWEGCVGVPVGMAVCCICAYGHPWVDAWTFSSGGASVVSSAQNNPLCLMHDAKPHMG